MHRPHPAATEPSVFDGIPPTVTPARTGWRAALAHVKAFLTIRWIHLAGAVGGLAGRLRRRPRAAGLAGAASVLLVAGVVAVMAAGRPKDVAAAREAALARPADAAAQRDLGHALFREGRRHEAILAYERAMGVDPAVADGRMVEHLVASFGGEDQRAAEELIWKNQLGEAQPALEALVGSDQFGVRWGAVRTLDRLEKGTMANWESAYIADLDEKGCRIRRKAVEKLGAIGTERSLAALREAKAAEQNSGLPTRKRCLGDRLAQAEREILARR